MNAHIDFKITLCFIFYLATGTTAYCSGLGTLEDEIFAHSDSVLAYIEEQCPNKNKFKIVIEGVENLNGELGVLENYVATKMLYSYVTITKKKFQRTTFLNKEKPKFKISSNDKGDVCLKVILIPNTNSLEIITFISGSPFIGSVKTKSTMSKEVFDLWELGDYKNNSANNEFIIYDDSSKCKADSRFIRMHFWVYNKSSDTVALEEANILLRNNKTEKNFINTHYDRANYLGVSDEIDTIATDQPNLTYAGIKIEPFAPMKEKETGKKIKFELRLGKDSEFAGSGLVRIVKATLYFNNGYEKTILKNYNILLQDR